MADCLARRGRCLYLILAPAFQELIVGLWILDAGCRDLLYLLRSEAHRERLGDTTRNLVLQAKDVGQISFVPFTPELAAAGSINETSVDADAFAGPLIAGLHHILHPELRRDFACIDNFAFVREGGR